MVNLPGGPGDNPNPAEEIEIGDGVQVEALQERAVGEHIGSNWKKDQPYPPDQTSMPMGAYEKATLKPT
jgi:hypothetical protein